ncbi:ComG operon protein 3 OS=Ureibacillus acetophenoni OX=614649 GN=SAMN05877842_102157 PE=3 SV=1 [Ureibacillus acetophenoni]|uniref:competence type IV pilus major pilin ComGC n=1 Tax=Ureibacillus sp. MALMAid1270 TaxID=3411629 RepID=UPI003BA6C5E6
MLKNQKGFTLVEMLIVLLVISVLIVLAIPNIGKHFATVDDKGCEAYETLVKAQVEAYKLEFNKYPTTVTELETAGYLKENGTKCSFGEKIVINNDKVELVSEEEGTSGDGSNP